MKRSHSISVKDMITQWEIMKTNNLEEKNPTFRYKDDERLSIITKNKKNKERETVDCNDLDNVLQKILNDTKQKLIKCIYKLYNINIDPDERFKRIEGFIKICKIMQNLSINDSALDTSDFSDQEKKIISELEKIVSQNAQLPWNKTVIQIDNIIEKIKYKILSDNQLINKICCEVATLNLDNPNDEEEDDVYLVSVRDNALLNKLEIFQQKVDNIKEEIQKYRSLKFSPEHWLQMLLRMSKELKQLSRQNNRDEEKTNILLLEIEGQIKELKNIFPSQYNNL